nr:hypothetical protein [Priestia megaterium]
MQLEFSIEEVEDIKPLNIKKYIQHRQQLAEEKAITIIRKRLTRRADKHTKGSLPVTTLSLRSSSAVARSSLRLERQLSL